MCQLRTQLCLPLLLLIPLRIATKSDPNPQMGEEMSPLCVCVSHWHQHRAGRDPQAQEKGDIRKTRPSAPNSGLCLHRGPGRDHPQKNPSRSCVGHKLMFGHQFLPSKPFRSLSWQQSLSGAFQQRCTHSQLLHDYPFFFFFFPLCN